MSNPESSPLFIVNDHKTSYNASVVNMKLLVSKILKDSENQFKDQCDEQLMVFCPRSPANKMTPTEVYQLFASMRQQMAKMQQLGFDKEYSSDPMPLKIDQHFINSLELSQGVAKITLKFN